LRYAAALFALAGLVGPLAAAPGLEAVPGPVAKILRQNCALAGCHAGRAPAKKLNLEPGLVLASAIDRPSAGRPEVKIIDRIDPEKSYLLAKISGGEGIEGSPMPLDRDPLSPADQRSLRDWVLSLKNLPSGIFPPPLSFDSNSVPTLFEGLTLANLPTTMTLDRGSILFRVSHRFYPSASTGLETFFGLDGPSLTLLGLGYGLSDRLTVDLGRTNAFKEIALGVHWAVAGQGPWPASATIHVGASFATEKIAGRGAWDARNFKMFAQLSLGRRLTERLAVDVVPSWASRANHTAEDPENVFGLGFGGRFRILEGLSVIGEWTPVLAGHAAVSNGWALGLEKRAGGHVFQVFALNTNGLTPPQYLPGGDLRLAQGDFRLGFNITRLF